MLAMCRKLDTQLNVGISFLSPQIKKNSNVDILWSEDQIRLSGGGWGHDHIHDNFDAEERFHIFYGPYISQGYVEDLFAMLDEIVAKAKDVHDTDFFERNVWFMCSIGRIRAAFGRGLLEIQIIIVRPCAQGKGVLGHMLLYLTKNLIPDVTLKICECGDRIVRIMDQRYCGTISDIMNREIINARGDYTYIDYTISNKNLFVNTIGNLEDLPQHTVLNGKDDEDLSPGDKFWGEAAIKAHRIRVATKLFQNHFCSVNEPVQYIASDIKKTVEYLEKRIHTDDNEKEKEKLNFIKNELEKILSDKLYFKCVFTKDITARSNLRTVIENLGRNSFFPDRFIWGCTVGATMDEYRDIYRVLHGVTTIVSKLEIRDVYFYGELPGFESIDLSDTRASRHISNFIIKNATKDFKPIDGLDIILNTRTFKNNLSVSLQRQPRDNSSLTMTRPYTLKFQFQNLDDQINSFLSAMRGGSTTEIESTNQGALYYLSLLM